ncbi:Endoribonuclease YbeY [Planctomycetes bacterium CA13]|uniref:Endoribonuclease YbeY n=1 Tax=Novipirellula herctigrandis TaxID=2527986 RepID=A0A5C5Z9G5_9BACT|nr:Endoribonuclease YbeY [Planctomycetes bacterium CA13]
MSNTLDNNPPNHSSESELSVEVIADDPLPASCSVGRIRVAVQQAAAHRGYRQGEIGVRVTNDVAIREINRRHLDHDYETDVISFAYLAEPPRIEGELVVSIETASRFADQLSWSLEYELLLYVVHGTLHITEMDDQTPRERQEMRVAEREVMRKLGVDVAVQFGPDTSGSDSFRTRAREKGGSTK